MVVEPLRFGLNLSWETRNGLSSFVSGSKFPVFLGSSNCGVPFNFETCAFFCLDFSNLTEGLGVPGAYNKALAEGAVALGS